MPSVPVGSLQPRKDCSWASHQVLPLMPRCNSREKRRTRERLSWLSSPIRESVTSRRSFTRSTNIRCNFNTPHNKGREAQTSAITNKHWKKEANAPCPVLLLYLQRGSPRSLIPPKGE